MSRRAVGSSYKEKYQSLAAVKALTTAALNDAEAEKNEIITAGNRAQASINVTLRAINSLLNIPRNVAWVADENGHTIVQDSTAVLVNQTLVADAMNVEQGVQLLGKVIHGYDRALEFLIGHVEELSEAIRTRAMIGYRNLTDIEEPLGVRDSTVLPDYESPPPAFADLQQSSSVTGLSRSAGPSTSIVPLNSSASIFSSFGAIPPPSDAHTPLFVNTSL